MNHSGSGRSSAADTAESDRRQFLATGGLGLAALGLGALSLPSGVKPTEPSGGDRSAVPSSAGFAEAIEARAGTRDIQPLSVTPEQLVATESSTEGPYYRMGSPYRAKIAPPLEPGEVLLVQGRVWGADTRKPLPIAVLDVWHADALGRYDNQHPDVPVDANVYRNRGRLVSDESGYYEFETIKPGRYQIGSQQWRPIHIHFAVEAIGYKRLITQMYFHGDPYNESDPFVKPSLIVRPSLVRSEHGMLQLATFDIVMTPMRGWSGGKRVDA